MGTKKKLSNAGEKDRRTATRLLPPKRKRTEKKGRRAVRMGGSRIEPSKRKGESEKK